MMVIRPRVRTAEKSICFAFPPASDDTKGGTRPNPRKILHRLTVHRLQGPSQRERSSQIIRGSPICITHLARTQKLLPNNPGTPLVVCRQGCQLISWGFSTHRFSPPCEVVKAVTLMDFASGFRSGSSAKQLASSPLNLLL